MTTNNSVWWSDGHGDKTLVCTENAQGKETRQLEPGTCAFPHFVQCFTTHLM